MQVFEFSGADHRHMARALGLARRGMYSAHPNPRVGCVLVRDDTVVGEGWHVAAGAAHAEVNALKQAGDKAAGSTAYVTLEPCAHHGRTGPCSEALIRAGLHRVVVALADPYVEVAGKGVAALRAAGITVDIGLMRDAAASLNAGFLSRMERGRPRVRVKLACSLDGRTAMASGDSQWITGEPARQDVQRLRAASGAILTGIGTVIADDPALTVRDSALADRQPLRAVLDSRLALPTSARLLALPGTTLVYCVDAGGRAALERAGATVIEVESRNQRPDLVAVLRDLAGRQVNDVLVEAGPVLAGALLDHSLVDELVIYQACHIMGSETRGLVATPHWRALTDRQPLRITDRRQVGRDTRITAVPEARAS